MPGGLSEHHYCSSNYKTPSRRLFWCDRCNQLTKVLDAQLKFKDKIRLSNIVMIAFSPDCINKKRQDNRMEKYRDRVRRNVLREFQMVDWKSKK